MNNSVENSISTKELFRQYNWYQSTFSHAVQEVFDEFFDENFDVNFISLSKNINCLLDKDSCFVTKIQIAKEYDMFVRLTDKVIEIILDKVLGKSKSRFNINKISDIEAKIITSFNRDLFFKMKNYLSEVDPKEIKRSNFDMVNLTFILKDKDITSKDAGKLIITLPCALLFPEEVVSNEEKFSIDNFPESMIFAKFIVGKTKFSLSELKNLESGDTVVFENSSIEKLKLIIFDKEMNVNINPNMNLLIPEDNNGGDNVVEKHNIWDNIEVEMNAEFEAVKIKLGELKDIESGLVVDLASLYDNKVTLKVENNPIAKGSLVIVNDRYGVKIEEVLAKNPSSEVLDSVQNPEQQESLHDFPESEENIQEEYEEEEENEEENNEDEEFDYSDFELEDENI